VDDDIRDLNLDVYDTKAGWWNPDQGELEIPEDWEFLPQGDPYLTRTVKAAGTWWHAWLPRRRGRPHRRSVGLWAPASAITAANEKAAATADARARRRQSWPKDRARQEARDAAELSTAIVAFLDFESKHERLARQIAREAAARAAVIGSGRVGRTRTIPLDERAALAARAYIRHRHTSYEEDLDRLWDEDFWGDEAFYRDAKAEAHEAVDEFLADHRRTKP
jgi:hypothetical protein